MKITNLEELIGIGKDTFAALGGGEAFLKKERQAWPEATDSETSKKTPPK
jgi:hypothetical protein